MDDNLKPFDLFDGLMVDTILMVKYGNSWAHYNSKKPDFKMAKGFIRGTDGDQWIWSHQYFYFDKNRLPQWDERILKEKFRMKKSYVKSPKL